MRTEIVNFFILRRFSSNGLDLFMEFDKLDLNALFTTQSQGLYGGLWTSRLGRTYEQEQVK